MKSLTTLQFMWDVRKKQPSITILEHSIYQKCKFLRKYLLKDLNCEKVVACGSATFPEKTFSCIQVLC